MSHTPGPWFVTRKWSVGPCSQEDDQSYGMVIPVADVFSDNRIADSSLIAAAPDLLEALRDLLEAYEVHDRFSEAARSAIAKAGGREDNPAAMVAAPVVSGKLGTTPVSDQFSEHNERGHE